MTGVHWSGDFRDVKRRLKEADFRTPEARAWFKVLKASLKYDLMRGYSPNERRHLQALVGFNVAAIRENPSGWSAPDSNTETGLVRDNGKEIPAKKLTQIVSSFSRYQVLRNYIEAEKLYATEEGRDVSNILSLLQGGGDQKWEALFRRQCATDFLTMMIIRQQMVDIDYLDQYGEGVARVGDAMQDAYEIAIKFTDKVVYDPIIKRHRVVAGEAGVEAAISEVYPISDKIYSEVYQPIIRSISDVRSGSVVEQRHKGLHNKIKRDRKPN